jgi:tagatose 1,6-diphosphate aldolase
MEAMERVRMTQGKLAGLDRCANPQGIIAAAAIDQRGSLRKAIARARGANGTASIEDLQQFKAAVVRVLTRHASAVLIDPEYGLEAVGHSMTPPSTPSSTPSSSGSAQNVRQRMCRSSWNRSTTRMTTSWTSSNWPDASRRR